jgi:6-phosphogluconolactonase
VKKRHYIYPDKESLAAAFICEVEHFLSEVEEMNRPAHIALSGGSTPLDIFKRLSDATRPEQWKDVHLYWGDERMVPPDDSQSNFGNTWRRLIEPLGIPREQVHRIHGEEDPAKEAKRYGHLLREMIPLEGGLPVFDWIWLGLGDDGHTASIFPNQLELWNSWELCEVATHPVTGQKRVTITGRVINAARRVTMLVSGKSKSPVVNAIVMKEGRYLEYPAFYINPGTGFLEWFMDQDATSWL